MAEKEQFDIIFLRHGESVGNAESRWQGQADFPLTNKGREQAQALAERWRDEKRKFDWIVASPLSRAFETAEVIGTTLNVPVETDPIWAERNIGEVAGLTSKEVNKRFPNREFTTPFSAIVGDEGEGDWELYLRAGKALHGLLRRKAGKYLIVSHGGLLNQVMYAVVGITPHANFSGPRFRFKNTGFAHVIYLPDLHRWQIDAVNDRAHWNGKDSD
jgi:2,3-bisphosphoglycerate-dependent phosphoglycerate mutase